jgi:hypothetical protein
MLFELLAQAFKERTNDPEFRTYAVDSLPVPVCDNIRIRRCRIYPSEEERHDDDDDDTPKKKSFRGYIASKRRYFYGLRVHLVVTGAGEPVEFSLAAGSEADVTIFKELELDLLPEGSIIFADKAYTDYDYEDLLEEAGGLHLKAQRKKNSKRPMPAWEEFLGKPIRQLHRDGVQWAEELVRQEDPRGHAEGLRVEDRVVPAGLLHSVLVGGNSGYYVNLTGDDSDSGMSASSP